MVEPANSIGWSERGSGSMIARRAIASVQVVTEAEPTESGPRCRSAVTIASAQVPGLPAVATMPHTWEP